ncbi:hypothetical protein GGI43DRAFT_394634 [Trichoderma evansii]
MAPLQRVQFNVSLSYHDSLHFSLDFTQPSVVHPELARVVIDNRRLELSALAYLENGGSTLLGNGAACPWLDALLILQGIPCHEAPPGWRPESTEPFRNLSVQEGCIGQALGEIPWDPSPKAQCRRIPEQLDRRQIQASSVGPPLA